jgi:Arc/MetJ-type ribon-helix-helix transcriptional regulator
LNQQQLELIDNSVAAGEAASREDLIRRALREFGETETSVPGGKPG